MRAEDGSIGYSPNERPGEYERLDLHTVEWSVTPLAVDQVASSYFDAPPGEAVAFDHASLMEDVDHGWRADEPLCSSPAPG